jgi:hypothetical protein
MLKLAKYELKKQMFSKFIILVLLGIVEIIFAYGVFINNVNKMGFGFGLLILLAFLSIMYLSFESIVTYSTDMKTKNSYMLFLTPNSSYRIIGAKVLTGGLQILLGGLFFFAVGAIDLFIVAVRSEGVSNAIDAIRRLIREGVDIDVNLDNSIITCVTVLIFWISVITLAFLCITLSTTFLANKKYKGILSFALFVIISIVQDKLYDATFGTLDFTYVQNLFASIGWYLVLIVASFFVTSWMLEKKVSL